jgi:hypothetical protein
VQAVKWYTGLNVLRLDTALTQSGGTVHVSPQASQPVPQQRPCKLTAPPPHLPEGKWQLSAFKLKIQAYI